MASPYCVRIADSREDRLAVYRFRQERGVLPRATLLPDARLDADGLRDALDPMAIVIVASEAVSGQLVGTVRTNFLREGVPPLYPQLYSFHELPAADWHCASVTSGWTMAWHLRDVTVPRALAQALFDLAQRERIRYDYLDCSDAERPFLESLGYRRLRLIQSPTRGHTHLMCLDSRDWTHLKRIGSPLIERHAQAI